jgi:hypothetical protein
MKRLNGYEKAEAYTDQEKLPVGGYVLKILDVKYQENDWGDVIVLSFDVEEGDYRGFFADNYRKQTGEDKRWKGTYRLRVPKEDGTVQDGWTMRRFKTVITNFEESNNGYHWDWNEQTLKGKLIGALFNNKEYDFRGKHGFFTNCHSLVTVEKIRSGKFEIPEDTLLGQRQQGTGAPNVDDFINVPDNAEDDGLPFD